MEIEKLYRQLSRMYSSPHNDSDEEMGSAKSILSCAINEDGETAEGIIAKMKQLAAIENDFKSKLSAAIKNRFWEKTFSHAVPRRQFNPNN
jgi:hypothetical protein